MPRFFYLHRATLFLFERFLYGLMEETMPKLKLTLAAIAVSAGLGMSGASAMPIDNLGSTAGVGTQAQTVRYVCNAWGRCWWWPNYYYGAYGYYPHRRYGGGYRRWHRW